jgi:hypothetical protein
LYLIVISLCIASVLHEHYDFLKVEVVIRFISVMELISSVIWVM